MSPQQLFERIVQVAPSFASVEAEHLRDNGALLPHVLMGDLLRFVGEHIGRAQHQPQPEVLAVLELLEAEVAGGNAEAQNLIAVSFLEHLEAEPFFHGLYALFGPRLRAAHAAFAWQRSPSQNAG
jgi:hypothetical protein